MEGFCRGCLIKYDDLTELLQYTEKTRRLYVYSTGLQVKRNDAFTFQLCKHCYLKMKLACNFKKMCRTSDKKFNNYLALKEVGDIVDFCTFIKSKDELAFRFPSMVANSTPAHQRSKDDDNESTCTSIRNFMTDILQAEEIPDTEASIIREVIEEEADVLDDSLDSHFLQDDASVDNDFQLDFSFSPFSTPHSNNERGTIPQQLSVDQVEAKVFNYSAVEKILQAATKQNEVQSIVKTLDNSEKGIESQESISSVRNFYIENTEINNENIESKELDEKINDVCSIDKKIEKALNNQENKEYYLDDILSTPQVCTETSSPSTPTIANILFGDKLDEETKYSNCNEKEIEQCPEKYDHVEGDIDILKDFLIKDTNDSISISNFKTEEFLDLSTDPKEDSLENKYDMTDFVCKMCDKKFNSAKALRIHFCKTHKLKIIRSKKVDNRKIYVCDICGKQLNDHANFARHKQTHLKEKLIFRCNRCSLECTSQSKLDMHMTTHIGHFKLPAEKNHICSICGTGFSSRGNLVVHMRRHTKTFTLFCNDCGKGYYRKSDLVTHLRLHNGERPFKCKYCVKSFARRDALCRHMKIHTDERPITCHFCELKLQSQTHLRRHLKQSKICLKLREKYPNEAAEIEQMYKTQQDMDQISLSLFAIQEESENKNFNVVGETIEMDHFDGTEFGLEDV